MAAAILQRLLRSPASVWKDIPSFNSATSPSRNACACRGSTKRSRQVCQTSWTFDLCRCAQHWLYGDAKRYRPALLHFCCRAARTSLVGARGRLLRASSRCSINVGISTGLVRKQTAPAFNAWVRIPSSENDVMKMSGTWHPWICKCFWSSTPLMPGIWMSVIRQELTLTWDDCKNLSADSKARVPYPSDRRSLCIASRTDASSSMIEITGDWVKSGLSSS
jgi:hypothetical protein